MHWHKFGRVFTPAHRHEKLFSHAANPLAIHLNAEVYRVYYSARDAENRSSVSYFDLDISSLEVVYIHSEPVFEFGRTNSFYSHGVSIGTHYQAGGNTYILFMGWQNRADIHWHGEIGQLLLNDDWTLSVVSNTPLMPLDKEDDISLSYPWVMQYKGAYSMWYGSTEAWDAGNGEMLHVLKEASSLDGIKWDKKGQVIPSMVGEAQAFSRPTVIEHKSNLHMWYSYRSGTGQSYRIGYACSTNESDLWVTNNENSGISVSDAGWDSEMIEYPFVFKHRNEIYMLYNGNGYGETGIGLAQLKGFI